MRMDMHLQKSKTFQGDMWRQATEKLLNHSNGTEPTAPIGFFNRDQCIICWKLHHKTNQSVQTLQRGNSARMPCGEWAPPRTRRTTSAGNRATNR